MGQKNQVHVHDQAGLVSIMITMIMMIVISLIVIGFTQVVNRNRRETLDRQLSTQAFYAAEAGVNDARKAINTVLQSGDPTAVKEKTSCGKDANYTSEPKLSTNPDVQYTCLLVSTNVEAIKTTASVGASSIVYVDMAKANGTNFSDPADTTSVPLTFKWFPYLSSATPENDCQTFKTFPPNGAGYKCGYGLLRVDLMQAASFGGAADLGNMTETFYFQPVKGAAVAEPVNNFKAGVASSDPRAHVVRAGCSATACEGKLMLSDSAKRQKYYARLTMMYRDAPLVEIDGGASNESYFRGAQAIIDSTGKSQDVLRRVQVRVSLMPGASSVPNGAIQSKAAVCKRFTVYNGYHNSECAP